MPRQVKWCSDRSQDVVIIERMCMLSFPEILLILPGHSLFV